MSLLKPVAVEQASAKVGIFAPQGAGKTTTAALILIGLSKTYHNGAPVTMMDTENGSDYLKPIFDVEGVELLVVKSRAFVDMRQALREAEAMKACGYLVDSYTSLANVDGYVWPGCDNKGRTALMSDGHWAAVIAERAQAYRHKARQIVGVTFRYLDFDTDTFAQRDRTIQRAGLKFLEDTIAVERWKHQRCKPAGATGVDHDPRD